MNKNIDLSEIPTSVLKRLNFPSWDLLGSTINNGDGCWLVEHITQLRHLKQGDRFKVNEADNFTYVAGRNMHLGLPKIDDVYEASLPIQEGHDACCTTSETVPPWAIVIKVGKRHCLQ